MLQTRPWEAAEHLETEDDMAAYLDAALEEGDTGLILAVLGDIARARGMTHMRDTPQVRLFAPHEWPIYKGLRLRALADSPDAFGSTLAAEQERTDAEWASRLAAAADSGGDLPLVAELGGEPIGLAWGRIEKSNPDVAALYQMWVAPNCRGLGAGRMLLEVVIAWAKDRGASDLELGVTYRDSPAMHLYRDAGFKPVGEPQPLRAGSELLLQPMGLKLRNEDAAGSSK